MDPLTSPVRFAVTRADPHSPAVQALIDRHLALMRSVSPPESVFAQDAAGLVADGARLFTIGLDGAEPLGIGAYKPISPAHVELKSMHVRQEARGSGAGRALLRHILAQARGENASRASLETGRAAAFEPAIALYRSEGFADSDPFADYRENPFSLFLTRTL